MYINFVCLCLEMLHIYNFKLNLKITSVIFRLFTNLLRTNLNKRCKNVYVIRIVIKYKKNNKITQKNDENAI